MASVALSVVSGGEGVAGPESSSTLSCCPILFPCAPVSVRACLNFPVACQFPVWTETCLESPPVFL